ncbi:MAG: SsrA-binding protein SmpB [Patescibacteria group bacterium]
MAIVNKKALFNYEPLEKYRAGLELTGQEVKSIRQGHGSLAGSYITIKAGQPFLIGAQVPAYQPNNNTLEYDPARDRKLLLQKAEIKELIGHLSRPGLTAIPLKLYNSGRWLKLELAVARGKKEHDKREVIKKREAQREISRTLKNRYK